MAKLDFFTIHVETDVEWTDTSVELNFVCDDHVTIIECEGVACNTDLNGLINCLKTLFEKEIDCTYEIKQYLDSFTHCVSVYGNQTAPSFAFDCDEIKLTERDNI